MTGGCLTMGCRGAAGASRGELSAWCAMTVAAVIKKLCGHIPWCEPGVLDATVELALEIAREGRALAVGGCSSRLSLSRRVRRADRFAARAWKSSPCGVSVSQRLDVVAIVVSESGVVRVFSSGHIEATLIPELWLLDRHRAQSSLSAGGGVDVQRLGLASFAVDKPGDER